MIKKCPICGADFSAPPTGRKTCSKACDSKLRALARTGNHRPWSVAARLALKQKLSTPDERERMLALCSRATAALVADPQSGPFDTNRNAMHWVLKGPDGTVYEVQNLTKFVRDHPKWFPNPNSARSALTAASKCVFGKASPSRKDRPFTQYKGWQVIGGDVEKEDES